MPSALVENFKNVAFLGLPLSNEDRNYAKFMQTFSVFAKYLLLLKFMNQCDFPKRSTNFNKRYFNKDDLW